MSAQKLTLADIAIMRDGHQAKKAILEKFQSIEEFLEKSNMLMYEESVKQYLCYETLKSKQFKLALAMTLDKDYEAIVLPRDKQVLRFVDEVTANSMEYIGKEDYELLVKIRDLCLQENIPLATARMQRALALWYYYNGDTYRAMTETRSAIELLKEYKSQLNLVVKYKSDLGHYYKCMSDYKTALKIYYEAEDLIPKAHNLDTETISVLYLRQGIATRKLKRYSKAQELFEKSLEYADTAEYLGKALINIGICYMVQGKYPKALKYYEDACRVLEGTPTIAVAYNNIAELYRCKGQYYYAMCYINRALHYPRVDKVTYFTAFTTFVEIKVMSGEIGDTLSKLMEVLSEYRNIQNKISYFVEGINIIAEHGKEDINLLLQLKKTVADMIKHTTYENSNPIDELLLCYGRVNHYIDNI